MSNRSAFFLVAAGLAAFLFLTAALIPLFFPGPLLRQIAGHSLSKKGLEMKSAEITGNLWSGISVSHFEADSDFLKLEIGKVDIITDWKKLLKNQLAAAKIIVISPKITFKKTVSGAKRHAAQVASIAGWKFAVADARLSEGSVKWMDSAGSAAEISGLNGEFRYLDGMLEAVRVAGVFRDVPMLLTGRLQTDTMKVEARIDVKGKIPATVMIDGLLDEPSFHLTLKADKPRLQAEAFLHRSGTWTISIVFRQLERKIIPAFPSGYKGKISGRIEADGRGLSPQEAAGRASWEFMVQDAGTFSGKTRFGGNAADWEIFFSTPGFIASAKGLFDRNRNYVDAELGTSGTINGFFFFPGVRLREIEGSGTVKGIVPALNWTFDGRVGGYSSGEINVEKAVFKGRGTVAGEWNTEASAELSGISYGKRTADSYNVVIDGNKEKHRISMELRTHGSSLTAGCNGSLSTETEAWSAECGSLDLKSGRMWRASKPFSITVKKGQLSLDGLSVSDGYAAATIGGEVSGSGINRMIVNASGVELRYLNETGLLSIPSSGTVSFELNISGIPDDPRGSLAVRAGDIIMAGLNLGSLSGTAEIKRKILAVDNFRWITPSGSAFVSGTIPLVLNGQSPDFRVQARTDNMDLSFLSNPNSPLVFRGLLLRGDILLSRERGVFNSSGSLIVSADEIASAPAGVRMKDIILNLKANGERAIVERGRAVSGKGNMEIVGSLNPVGPELRAIARDFPIDSATGFSGIISGTADLEGTWSGPRITGDISILRGDYTPVEGKTAEMQEESGPTFKRVSGDLRVHAERNVWYKEGATYVEAKGDLAIKKDINGPLRIYGTMESVRGHYEYLTKSFELEKGILFFKGDSPPNPVLEAEALYKDEQSTAKVHLQAGGNVSHPKIMLFSEPPMDQRDIISMLLFGRPLYDFYSKTDALAREKQQTGAAAQQLAAEYLLRSVRRKAMKSLELDILKVKLATPKGPDITVGQYLTKDMFITYGQSLGSQGQRRITAEYTWTAPSLGDSLSPFLCRA
ncbi:MAG: translocation/assembly module TamB domain-containing protein [bacterium]